MQQLIELYNLTKELYNLLLDFRNKTNLNPLLFLYHFFALDEVLTAIECELLQYPDLPFDEKTINRFKNICLHAKEQDKQLTEFHIGNLNDIHLTFFLLKQDLHYTDVDKILQHAQTLKNLLTEYVISKENKTQSQYENHT